MPTSTTNSTSTLSQTLSQAINGSGTLARASQRVIATYNNDLLLFKVLSVFISLVLLAGVILIMIQSGWLSTRVDRIQHIILKTDMPKKRAQAAWKKTQAHFFAGDDNDLKIAIIQADNLLEEALRFAGVKGTNMGERLKNLKKNEIPNLEQIWQAHKLRNQIAHEPNFTIKRDLAERALGIYEQALHNLGVLNEEK